MTDEQGHPERANDSTVDGPTAMTPTTGRFGGPPPAAPTPSDPAEPTVPDPPQTSVGGPTVYGPTTGHHLVEPTPDPATAPVDALTIAELATAYGPTTYSPTTGRHENPAAEPTRASSPDEPTFAEWPTGTRPTTSHLPDGPATKSTHTNPLDEPTVADKTTGNRPTTSHLPDSPATKSTHTNPLDEPTVAEPIATDKATGNRPTTSHHGSAIESTVAIPLDEPAAAYPTAGDQEPLPSAISPVDEPTTVAPFAGPADDEPTAAVGTDDPTTESTGDSWPFDEFEPPPPDELVWQADAPPPGEPVWHSGPQPATRSPAYYVALGAAVVLVVGLVALATVVTVMRPRHEVAGVAAAAGASIPTITPGGQPPPATTSTAQGPLAAVAAHPLSSSTARMADATCALPRFDPADDKQAAFFAAAKVCADNAWRGVLQEAGLDGAVTVVMVTGAVRTDCGDLAPTVASTECDGTVYLTPAYLRDTEQNGRYPGRYLGVFLREYARALQDVTGLDEVVGTVTTGTAADLDTRVDQQATCLAGVVSGAMAGRGAIDANITGEIRARLTTVDAAKDAQAWLDKGFQQRTPAACNAWLN
jgi:hypothetical protein